MPKKDPDYSKLKALHDSILQYIGDAKDTGEDPDLPEPTVNKGSFDDVGTSYNGQGGYESQGDQEPRLNFLGNELGDGKEEPEEQNADADNDPEEVDKKKKKASSLAMMSGMLKASVSKGNQA